MAAETDIIRRMAAGDERALGELYDRWSASVYALVLRLLGDPEDAEDVVEEVFWQAWRQAGRYQSERGQVSAWLMTIARSRGLDRLRSRRRRPETLLAEVTEDLPMSAPDPLATAAGSERRARVLSALSELPSEQRQAVEMAYFDGLSQTEIAERTAQPLGTVKTRVRLAMQKLRERLGPLREEFHGA
ncbi:MAG: sigma-70 family RNA polymerase sigma factor [Gemmatimonadaceae bacterium]